jgi:hypothetical protein
MPDGNIRQSARNNQARGVEMVAQAGKAEPLLPSVGDRGADCEHESGFYDALIRHPRSRHNFAVFRPASCGFKIPMTCSSLNGLFILSLSFN